MKQKRRRRWPLLLAFYALALVVWLAVAGIGLLADNVRRANGTVAEQVLGFADFEMENLALVEDHEEWLVSTNTDPQLVYRPAGALHVGRVEFTARALNVPPGEMTLYYTTREDESFTDAHRLWARRLPGGSWVFDLGGKRITALRLDPDTAGGVIWEVDGIVLNARKPTLSWFLPDALQAALLLCTPPLAWALVYEIVAFLSPIFARRRLSRLAAQKAQPEKKQG